VTGRFTLLGSLIDNQGHCASEIKRHLVLGRMAMGNLEKVWKNRDISQNTEMTIVKTLVYPVVSYRRESSLIKKAEKKEDHCLRNVVLEVYTEDPLDSKSY